MTERGRSLLLTQVQVGLVVWLSGVMGQPIGHVRPGAHVQVLGYPFQRHAGFGPQPTRQTVGVNLPIRLATGFTQGLEKAGAVGIVLVDRLTPVAAVHNAIHRTRVFDAQLAGHGHRLPPHQICVNSKERPLSAI